ncbi:MAG: L-fucose:H+ symporter permease [Chthoniobacterales bacterium]|jgi:FHS family L-fucose permease-like MFS transporter
MESPRPALLPRSYIASFILVTTLFSLWGFANDITNPMVAAFKNVLLISHFESSLVQAAFYGGYCVMAIPAALFIRRFTYKSGILTGLGLYALGCLLFIPAGGAMEFAVFLAAYFIMTSGLAFLETTANPYILSMGPEETAARRLNFAQAFNPVGSLLGMFVAKDFILGRLDPADEAARRALAQADPAALEKIQIADLAVIVWPYAVLGGVVLLVLVVFALAHLPDSTSHEARNGSVAASLGRLLRTPDYVWGVVAQAFYVGVQIMVWTFIIQYAVNELGLPAKEAQGYNIIAMIVFVSSRFICTYLLKFFNPGMLLAVLAVAGGALVLGAIFIHGMAGLYCLVGVSACMSLMFPTIYGIALKGLGDDAKLGSAGLICAIGGGCVMPPLQALIMDGSGIALGGIMLSATRASFFLPLLCFVVIAFYGTRSFLAARR